MTKDDPGFLEMFPFCADLASACGGLDRAAVRLAEISSDKTSLVISVRFCALPTPAEILSLEARIAGEFGLREVLIKAMEDSGARISDSNAKKKKTEKKEKQPEAKKIFGTAIKGTPVPIGTIGEDSGSVIVEGEVYEVSSRQAKNRSAWILSFSITDNTGSIRVSKFMREGEDASVIKKIEKGMYLKVQGHAGYNRFEDDLRLEPKSIAAARKIQREDKSRQKRVELHCHTRFSAMDALCDPAQLMETASRWGHKAIAVTDHGVAQAFPDFWKASGKYPDLKIIYGMEGYFVNDVDEELIVTGESGAPLDGEFVALDIETTGLSERADRMTEIGAVIFKGGEVTARFETFVNPGRPIPQEITNLTGITDRDVFDAPDEAAAMHAFLEFAGERPIAAHNAGFDIGFMVQACLRSGIRFEPEYIDTLALSRGLLPDMKSHRLDSVAQSLGLPSFRHHRAGDDAVTVARIFEKFLPMLEQAGARTTLDLNGNIKLRGKRISRRRTRHIALLVKDKTGLKNLYKLITKSHLEYFKKSPIIPKSLLLEYREGLIIGSACCSGEVFAAVLGGRNERELQRLAEFYDYLEIQPLCNNSFLVRNGKVSNEETLRDLNRRILELGRKLGKPVVATGDVHFLEPEHEIYRHILLEANSYSDADAPMPVYFKTTDEMMEEFSYLGENVCREVVITNPNMIADMCENIRLFPKDLFTPKIENSERELKELVYGRLRELYGDDPPGLVRARVDAEMSDIIRCKYDVIYMCAQKLVANSLEAGYLVGSRGSVGSSIAAYLSGITEVNSLPAHYRCTACRFSDFESGAGYGCGADMPGRDCPVCGSRMKKDGFDIPFETFLGFDGDKIPDIDLNFSGEYQSRAHKYTEELFGKDHVFRAGTIGTLADKTAYAYTKKYLEARGRTVTKAEENRLAAGCVGVKRLTGQHPGGLVIIPQDMDVTDFCPVQRPADSMDSGVITTHFDYHSMEDNLLKLDELGHDDPTMIKMLEDLTGINARDIPLDDPETMLIFSSPEPLGIMDDDPIIGKTGTIGIPEFGTGFTRGMLVDTMPKDFDTLVRLSGFSHGTDVWLGNAKDLILNGTASIGQTIGCRDDIMLFLISKGMNERIAFKIMESVRKGRGLTPEWEEQMRSLDIPGWYIDSCKKIKYLFPKAHAVAYVMMAFRIAWFKVHYPLAYYSAHFYRRSDSFDAVIMINGVDQVRKKIREISGAAAISTKEQDMLTTLESVYEFYLRGFSFERIDLYQSDSTRFSISGEKALRPPFTAISGLGEAAAQSLMQAREGRRFVSVEELMGVCGKVNQAHMEQLRVLGAFGNMPDTSQMSLF